MRWSESALPLQARACIGGCIRAAARHRSRRSRPAGRSPVGPAGSEENAMKKLLCVGLVLCGCEKANPYYCKDNPDHNCTIDGSGTAMSCTSNAQCTDPNTLVCDTAQGSGACVQCTAGEHS